MNVDGTAADATMANEAEKEQRQEETVPPVDDTAKMSIDKVEDANVTATDAATAPPAPADNDGEPPPLAPTTSSLKQPPSLDSLDMDDDDISTSSSSFSSTSTTTVEREATDDSPLDDTKKKPKDPNEIMIQAVTLKEEGNVYFKEGDYIKASRSYRRGTSMLKKLHRKNTGDAQVKALLVNLLTNQSMVFSKQKKHKQSRDVATKALEMDETHVKALYRRAVAHRQLGDYDHAKADLKLAMQHDKTNVTVKREFVSLKKQIESIQKQEKKQMRKAFGSILYQDKEKQEQARIARLKEKEARAQEELAKRKQRWEDECVKRMTDNEEPIPYEEWDKEETKREEEKRKQDEQELEKQKQLEKEQREAERKARREANKAAAAKEESSEEEEEFTPEELAMMRGYKKTTDGRTTSYFTREQSEHEKQLIGDIAPKRIIEPTSSGGVAVNTSNAATTTSSLANSSSTSAWNQAGTWEERDTTDWCTERLKLLLANTKHNDQLLEASVTEVKELTGHASVAMLGSVKTRYIFDFHAKLKYELSSVASSEIVATSSFHLPDISSISADDHHDLEIHLEPWTKEPSIKEEELFGLEHVIQCRDELVKAVRASVQAFVKEFNQHY